MEKLAEGYGLIEAPLWIEGRGLLFSDVLGGGVYCVREDGEVAVVFEHRRGIGGMVLHEAGGVVVSGRNISYKPFGGGDTVLLLDRDPERGNVGYNDITTDAEGRILAGSLGSSPVFADDRPPASGDLYRIEADGGAAVVGRDILLTNGLGFSPDGGALYHSDSRRQTVIRYDVDGGEIGAPSPFVTLAEGVPDGLAVAGNGDIYVALAGGGHGVAVYDAAGAQKDFIEIPRPMCTSVCFGGADLRDLYIVSGSDGAGSERAGAVFRTRVDAPGLPVPAARVRLP